jgi:hypothetical protein
MQGAVKRARTTAEGKTLRNGFFAFASSRLNFAYTTSNLSPSSSGGGEAVAAAVKRKPLSDKLDIKALFYHHPHPQKSLSPLGASR